MRSAARYSPGPGRNGRLRFAATVIAPEVSRTVASIRGRPLYDVTTVPPSCPSTTVACGTRSSFDRNVTVDVEVGVHAERGRLPSMVAATLSKPDETAN